VDPKHLKLLQKAQLLDRSGNNLAAANAYKEFLDREPGHADTWADYAGMLLLLGKPREAEAACSMALAIDPHHAPAKINQGSLLLRQGRLEDAEIEFRSVLVTEPERMDARLFLAQCLLNKQDLEKARLVLEDAKRLWTANGRYSGLRTNFAELWALFSTALRDKQWLDEAEDACATALQLDPLNFRARANFSSIRMMQGKLDEAEIHIRRLMADHPKDEKARLLWITCLTWKGDSASASREIATVLQREPESFLVHKSVMGPYYSLGLWTEYRAEIERFRRVDSSSAFVDYEESFVDLLSGNMRQGWERFEARLKVPRDLRPQRSFAEPAWNGEPFAGKTLLVWSEQGFGDTFMFVRYLPLVKALGGRVLLETQPALLDVAATCKGVDLVLPQGAPLPPIDLHISLMSLPWIFRTDLASIPDAVPYLAVPKSVPHRHELLEQLAVAQEGTRIGLVWAGSPSHARDIERSLSGRALAPLKALPGVSWFSLQVGGQDAPPLPGLVALEPLLQSFSDTAFALDSLDLLITVDTSVAHLAGALGIPTLLLLTYQPDYRWMLNRHDSPWYPTMRLYRQPAYGDWDSVVQQVLMDLTQDA
jgi:tetratricopeptide (TPR) repeat protein